MSDMTSRLALPLIAAGQAQKHLPVNEALSRLDVMVQACALSRSLATPPEDAADGDTYIVAPGATALWQGREASLAIARAGGWEFLAPTEGLVAWVSDEDALCAFGSGGWTVASGSGSQNLTRFGFGTEADAASPFSVKTEQALFTARALDEGGTGDLRLVMNKDAPGNVASLLLQSGYSGRAEIGLVGDDDLVFKVADANGLWREALKLDRATGRVRFPNGGVREQFAGDRTLFVRVDGSDANSGTADTAAGAFRTIQHAYDVVVATLDLAGFTLTISVGAGAFDGLSVDHAWTGGGRVIVAGAGAAATSLSGTGHLISWSVALPADLKVRGCRLSTTGAGDCIRGGGAGRLIFEALEFGECGGRHVATTASGASARCTGAYSISGGAVHHWSAEAGSTIDVEGRAITLSGTPAFSAFAQAAAGGNMAVSGNLFSGGATGIRYIVSSNGVVRTGGAGAAYLPGNGAGTSSTGGQYV
jgi:hypothetical protein